MACVTLLNSVKMNVRINVGTSLQIAAGSVAGGMAGKITFDGLFQTLQASDVVTAIQAAIIGVLMIAIFLLSISKRSASFEIKSGLAIIGIGFLLGLIAAFLGIGGDPFNVAILILLFSMEAKEAALNSTFIIFFSQLSSLLFTAVANGFAPNDLTMLPFMIIGGILGGLSGSALAKRVSNRLVEQIFYIGLIFIIAINVYNIMKYFI